MPYNLTVKQRIQKFAETTNLEDKYFEQRVGMSNGMLRRENNPTTPMLEKLKAAYPRLDMNWLITGEGPMLLPEKGMSKDLSIIGDHNIITSEVAESQLNYGKTANMTDIIEVPLSIMAAINEQLKKKDAQIAFLQAEVHELIGKI